MSRRSTSRAPMLALLALVLCLPAASSAIDFKKADAYVLSADESQGAQLWLLSQQASVAGSVADDMFLLTQTADLSGQFDNDLWSLAEDIDFGGHVNEHARLVGTRVDISGTIGSSLTACGNVIKVNKNATVGGDVLLVAETIVFDGHAGGSSRLIGSSVTLGGTFGDSVRVIAEDIAILPGTEILGDLVYTSGKEVFLDPKVQLQGELVRQAIKPAEPAAARAWGKRAMIQAYLFFGALLVGVIWLALFRRRSVTAAMLVRKSMWRCALVGIIAFCLIPMVAFFALFTFVGWPLAALTTAIFCVLLYGAKIIAGLALGTLLLRNRDLGRFAPAFSALLCGLVLLYFLAAIPMFSFAVWFMVTVVGLGGLILSIMGAETPSALLAGGPTADGKPPPPLSPDTSNIENTESNHNKEEQL